VRNEADSCRAAEHLVPARRARGDLMSTITDSNVTVWVDEQSWGKLVDQKLETAAIGVPETPAETGRRAVDERSEDLRQLAES
jgi:hypothetical protein